MKIVNVKKAVIIIIAMIAMGFVFSYYISDLDTRIDNLISGMRGVAGMKYWGYLSMLGEKYLLGLFALIFSYFLWKLPPSEISYLKLFWISFGLNLATGYLLKIFIGRDRPLGAELLEGATYSFPSGHALASIFFYGFVAFIIFKFSNLNLKIKYLIFALSAVLVLLIGFSRIYLGVHYVSDIIAGYLIGWMYLNMGLYFLKDIPKERKLNVVKMG